MLSYFFFENSTLISATELSLRQSRATSSTSIFTSSHSNPSLLHGSYEGLRFPRRPEKNLEITDERASQMPFRCPCCALSLAPLVLRFGFENIVWPKPALQARCHKVHFHTRSPAFSNFLRPSPTFSKLPPTFLLPSSKHLESFSKLPLPSSYLPPTFSNLLRPSEPSENGP